MWVQIHGLQTGFKSSSVVERLGGFVGMFIKSNPKNFQHVWREYIRVRVSIDITVPLKRMKKLRRSVDDPGIFMRAQPRRRYNLVGSQWLRDGEESDVAFTGGSNSSTGAVGGAPTYKEQTLRIDGKVDFELNNDNLNMLDELEDGVDSLIVLDTKRRRMVEANVGRTQLDGSNVGRAQVDRFNVVAIDSEMEIESIYDISFTVLSGH
ncbi:hypothetical protein F8388_023491 [Cannabis sativa]|uniref:DUF4283 domain-containing protein n=1 Tax=Cannabis sativa TaxID=3483 RepID=A0A7J6GNX0_CANSA|nr:hypothetical protein F8388_023491 [Cannabis sativa]